ncbi:MAG: hypothetical protein WDN29_10760 [Methylovirgula sp.]
MADASLQGMAELLGVTPSAAKRLANEGLLVRSTRGRFNLEASVRKYTGHLREVASNRSDSPSALATIRQKTAMASLAEARTRQMSEAFMEVAVVQAAVKKSAQLWKSAFIQLPQRFRVRMKLTLQQEQQMEALVDERLNELSEETLALKSPWDEPTEKPPTPRIRLNRTQPREVSP